MILTTVGRADTGGTLRFDDVPSLPWSMLGGTIGFSMPVQVVYRDPVSTCGTMWIATNAVVFSLSL